jgi:hypothetical protein
VSPSIPKRTNNILPEKKTIKYIEIKVRIDEFDSSLSALPLSRMGIMAFGELN